MALQVPSHAEALLRRIAGPDGLLADRYRPLEVLGQGGMGVVFHAVDERLGRDVAIKSLRADLASAEFVARFATEAMALARIHHPNVVQILDVSEPGSPTAYYVMELVRGTPLSRLLRERGSLPWAQAYDVLAQVASALATVHKAKVVHRDLKPSNLLCAEIGRESWHVKLIDFGIALSPGAPRLTRPGEVLGTLPYMAPEQFAGVGIDRRTDVYGWGVLALELLGGISPAELFGNEALAGAPLRDSAQVVLERARVRQDIVAIVRRCLATQPDERWPDMDAVYAELHERDDGGTPTLIFQRSPVVPKGGTMVPFLPNEDADATRPTRHGETLAGRSEDAETSVREPVVARDPSSSDSAALVVASRSSVSSPAIERDARPTNRARRSRGPTVLAACALAVSVVGASAWVAHAYGWLKPDRCAHVVAAMHAWPRFELLQREPQELPAAIAPAQPEPPAPSERPPSEPPPAEPPPATIGADAEPTGAGATVPGRKRASPRDPDEGLGASPVRPPPPPEVRPSGSPELKDPFEE